MTQLFSLLLLPALMLASCDDDHAGSAGPVKVTGITLNETAKSLAPEGTFQLSVTEVLPSDTADQTMTWSSIPTTVATVDQTGLVTVLATAADGATATITATANDGSGVTATCAITVAHVKVTSITLNQTTASLASGETLQLSTTSVLPNNATNKNATWSSIPTSVATVGGTGLVTVAAGAAVGQTATITAMAADGGGATATCTVTVCVVPVSALINGVTWATHNVDAPGTFAATPQATGMFYQWNRKTGWSSSDPLTSSPAGATWDDTTPTGDFWASANDPCPAGWRLPTKEEQTTLFDEAKVTKAWVTTPANGYKFTDIASSKSIFLPAAGYRSLYYGTLNDVGGNGAYWSSTMGTADKAWYLFSYSDDAYQHSFFRTYGFTVRCVLQ